MRSTLVSGRLSGSLSLWVTLKSPKWCEDIIMIIIVLLNLYWTKVFCYTFDPCTLIYLFLAPEIFWKGLAVARYCCSVLDVHFWRLSQRVLQCLTIFKCFNALEYLIYFVAFLLFEAGLKMGRYTQQQFSLNGHCFMSWWQHLLPNDKHSLGQISSALLWQIWKWTELVFPLLVKLALSSLWKAMVLFQCRALSCQGWQRCFHLLHVKMSEIHLLLGLHLSQWVFLE